MEKNGGVSELMLIDVCGAFCVLSGCLIKSKLNLFDLL